ncbi:MAG TPA: hypoxanthine phosphoribosyltransferase [Clostridia bacterium]|nr:hypoxanthine phosphoribosyltransferase [Clostridia bacterium]
MYDDIEKVLLTEETINDRIKELAKQISDDYKGEEIVMVCILRGSCLFFSELVKRIPNYVELEFITVSSYSSTNSSGEVRLIADISKPIQGQNVLIVEDIIDTGYTLNYLKRLLLARNPKSLKIASLLDKPSRRKVECEGDYIGFEVPNEFVVGYGLDYDQKYRNYPHIGVLKKEIYSKGE